MRRSLTVLAVLPLALGIAACGGGESEEAETAAGDATLERQFESFGEQASTEDADAMAALIEAALRAAADNDWEEACSLFSSEARAQLAGLAARGGAAEPKPGCPGVLARSETSQSRDQLREAAEEISVEAVRVDGERGYIHYSIPSAPSAYVRTVLEDGEWRIAELSPG
jgi:hypothetical protein